jgi:hypothetical protein
VSEGQPRRSVRFASYAPLIAALAASVFIHVLPAWDAKAFDLSAILVGAKVVRDEGFAHLYEHDPAVYNQATSPSFTRAARELGFDDVPTPFVYAPLVAILGEPFASTPQRWIVRGWCIVSALFVALGLVLGAKYFTPGYAWTPSRFAALALALALFEPIRYALWLGQTTPFVFVCVMFALVAAEREKPVAAGIALALPAFLKLTPTLFVLPWLWQRRYRAASAFACALGVLVLSSVILAGSGPNVAFLERLLGIGSETVVAYNNQGLPAFLERLRHPAPQIHSWDIVPLSGVTRITVSACIAAMFVTAWYALRDTPDRERERLSFAVVTTILLLAPTISWTHYALFLVPPLLGCVAIAERSGRRWLGVGVTIGVLVMCSRPLLLDHINHQRGPLTVIVGPTIAAAILYVFAIVVARITAEPMRADRH